MRGRTESTAAPSALRARPARGARGRRAPRAARRGGIPSAPQDARWMARALSLAREAAARGEVPVGAVLVDRQGRRLGSGSNLSLRAADPTAHAEIVALRRAARRGSNYRLGGATLYSTLEPCPMCLGALVHARVQALVYAAPDPKGGGISLGVFPWRGANHRIEVRAGLMASESAALLRDFFRARRVRGGPTASGRGGAPARG